MGYRVTSLYIGEQVGIHREDKRKCNNMNYFSMLQPLHLTRQ